MKNKITTCNNCPFHNSEGEYDDTCNHPASPKYPQNILKFHDNAEEIPTKSTDWGFYHSETHSIPKWCPLKGVKSIYIPEQINIDFDKRLFEQ